MLTRPEVLGLGAGYRREKSEAVGSRRPGRSTAVDVRSRRWQAELGASLSLRCRRCRSRGCESPATTSRGTDALCSQMRTTSAHGPSYGAARRRGSACFRRFRELATRTPPQLRSPLPSGEPAVSVRAAVPRGGWCWFGWEPAGNRVRPWCRSQRRSRSVYWECSPGAGSFGVEPRAVRGYGLGGKNRARVPVSNGSGSIATSPENG